MQHVLKAMCNVDGLVEYIQKRIAPVITEHVLDLARHKGTPLMWTNYNAESLNNMIKNSTQLPDLINTLYSHAKFQKKETE